MSLLQHGDMLGLSLHVQAVLRGRGSSFSALSLLQVRTSTEQLEDQVRRLSSDAVTEGSVNGNEQPQVLMWDEGINKAPLQAAKWAFPGTNFLLTSCRLHLNQRAHVEWLCTMLYFLDHLLNYLK